ncbi:hypothetical protein [Cupriavidus sp. D39]|uniref:hypothetical protein n=1 Tax=Cupriavidus sp. D39 TaxID=2997877 RepID=UPI002270C2AD|nr:hypothetical protein [Cupriavidus sp. D39]MCY0854133.1 hypothetical protein [Cupriavidus sp. D39]
MTLNETHDPARKSWVEAANNPIGDFPLQNLPLGVFSHGSNDVPHLGIAIGDQIFDLVAACKLGLLPKSLPQEAIYSSSLNALFSLGQPTLGHLRRSVWELARRRPIRRRCSRTCI